MNRVIDSTIFSGELDMLEIRLKYLSSHVDLFAICESNKTFQGGDKPYYLEEHWSRFEPFHSKMVYLQIEQDPSIYTFNKVDRYDPSNGPFQMEHECRNSLMYVNDTIEPKDLVILSDVDEIWNKHRLDIFFKEDDTYLVPPTTVSTDMNFYGYFLNNLNTQGADIRWRGSVICSGKYWKENTPQHIRDMRNRSGYLPDMGWHFSWMNDIKRKIQSFAHVEFNREEITSDQAILSAVEKGEDVLQRPGVKYELQPMSTFPDDLRSILEQYPHLIK